MRFARISQTVRSLSFRLTTWNTLVVVLVAVAGLFIAREGLRITLLQETDGILGDEAAELVLAAEESPDLAALIEVLERKSESHAQHRWFFDLIDERENVVWQSGNVPAAVSGVKPDGVASGIVAVEGSRFAQRRLRGKHLPGYWIRVGTPTDFIDVDVDRITRYMILAAVVVTLLSPLGGYMLARRAVAPLREIIAGTRRLRPSNFDDRLPLRNTGDELDQLSAEINDFLDQIADHLQRQHDFLANAAHELRSPLTAIQSSLDVAISRHRSAEEYEELLPTVIDECARLTTLVNQLLVLAENDAKANSGRHQLVRFDDAVRKSVEMFSGVAEENSLRLEADIEDGVLVEGHLPHLRQVVANLLDNAVKFTPVGGLIKVSLRTDAATRSVVFSVRDTGVGIPPEDLPRIFDRFYRGDKSHQHVEGKYGSGLGLSICRSIAAVHDGRIDVESELGKGTCFTVVLPAATALSASLDRKAENASASNTECAEHSLKTN
jgi:heavy metal sensor kinase